MTSPPQSIEDVFVEPDGTERRVAAIVVSEQLRLSGTHNGSVCIDEGATLSILRGANHNGSLCMHEGSTATIEGTHNGPLKVAHSARVVVSGRHHGPVDVSDGGFVGVEKTGRLAGPLEVGGTIQNFGERGGPVEITGGELIDEPGATVRLPSTDQNGNASYTWND